MPQHVVDADIAPATRCHLDRRRVRAVQFPRGRIQDGTRMRIFGVAADRAGSPIECPTDGAVRAPPTGLRIGRMGRRPIHCPGKCPRCPPRFVRNQFSGGLEPLDGGWHSFPPGLVSFWGEHLSEWTREEGDRSHENMHFEGVRPVRRRPQFVLHLQGQARQGAIGLPGSGRPLCPRGQRPQGHEPGPDHGAADRRAERRPSLGGTL